MATVISKLKSDALKAADSRGHDMLAFEKHITAANQEVYLSTCRNCHFGISIDPNATKPIFGEAVDLDCDVTPMLGKATYCVKVMLSQKTAQFIFIDATSEEDAIAQALKHLRPEDNADDFAQVGIYYTDHILHQLARGLYQTLRGEKVV